MIDNGLLMQGTPCLKINLSNATNVFVIKIMVHFFNNFLEFTRKQKSTRPGGSQHMVLRVR